jgi:hypothetical protein
MLLCMSVCIWFMVFDDDIKRIINMNHNDTQNIIFISQVQEMCILLLNLTLSFFFYFTYSIDYAFVSCFKYS